MLFLLEYKSNYILLRSYIRLLHLISREYVLLAKHTLRLRYYSCRSIRIQMCAEASNCDILFEYVNRSSEDTELGGYRRDLIVKELTPLEENMLVCKVCRGVMRDDCFRRHDASRRASIDPGVVGETISKLRILCPLNEKGCEWVGLIPDAESHLDQCDYKPNRCIFSEYGCPALIPRGRIDTHLQESSSEHMLQLLEQVKRCALQVERSALQLERSGIEMERLRTQNLELEERFKQQQQSLASKLNAAEISSRIRGEGFHWSVSDVSHKIEDCTNLWGPYLYVDGYKFQLKVCFGFENKSSLALFLCVVRGEQDDLLRWPFKLESEKFVFSMRNSSGSDTHLLTITTGDSTQAFKRPEGDRKLHRGTEEFVSHSDLLSLYCLDNNFTVRVCVRPRTDAVDALRREVQALSRSQDIRGSGYMWRVEGVAQKIADRENAGNIWGPSFYVGRYLFQPAVRFHCNNQDSMGLFIALFKGPHDNDLPWPFRFGSEKFSFSLLDKDGRESVTNSVSVDEKNRDLFNRPDGHRNKAYGCPNLIPHKSLTESVLQDDSLTVKIAIKSRSLTHTSLTDFAH